MKIYIRAAQRLFFMTLLSFLLFYPVSMLVRMTYSALNSRWETIFPIYNSVTEKNMQLAVEQNLALTASVIIFALLTLLAVIFDNERYEFMIRKTEGFFTLRQGLVIYGRRYAAADILSSVLSPIPLFALSLFKFPKTEVRLVLQLEEWTDSFLIAISSFTDKLGFVAGYICAVLVILTFKAPSAVIGLSRWRGLWLSDVDN